MKRRNLLRSTGLISAASTLPYSRLALSGTQPKRFIVFYTHQGAVTENWRLGNSTLNLSMEVIQDNPILHPLKDWASHIAIIDGLALVSGELDGNAIGFRHETAAAQILTGAPTKIVAGVPLGTRASLDQLIAGNICHSAQFASVEWGVGTPFNTPIYLDASLPLPAVTSVEQAYQFLKGNSYGLDARVQQQNFDNFDVHFAEMLTSLTASDQEKLQHHQDFLSDIFARNIDIQERQEQCSYLPPPLDLNDYNADFTSFLSLLEVSFSCDLTRVLSINMGQLPMSYLHDNVGDVHFEIAHNIHVDSHAKELMTQYSSIHAEHFALLLQRLDNTIDPLGAGESLLSNTLVLWISNLGDGSHCYNNLPVIVAGGENFSNISLGQYHHLTETSPVRHWDGVGFSDNMGIPHQRLLNTLALQFDLGMNSFDLLALRSLRGELLKSTGILEEILT